MLSQQSRRLVCQRGLPWQAELASLSPSLCLCGSPSSDILWGRLKPLNRGHLFCLITLVRLENTSEWRRLISQWCLLVSLYYRLALQVGVTVKNPSKAARSVPHSGLENQTDGVCTISLQKMCYEFSLHQHVYVPNEGKLFSSLMKAATHTLSSAPQKSSGKT